MVAGGVGALLVLAFLAGLRLRLERAVTPPPLDEPGHTYTCRCWLQPVRVTVVDNH